VNALFYIVSFFVLLGVMGVDTTSLFVALAGVLVSFAFMIGSASAKYVEVRSLYNCVQFCLLWH
jgi:hypothetical protein